MRKLLVVLSLFVAFPAMAQGLDETIPVPGWSPALEVPERTRMKLEKPKLKFQKKKLWNLLALPAYFMLEVTIHEGSHATAALFNGYHVTAFKPYPHKYGGQLLWGAFYMKEPAFYSKNDELVIAAAPYLVDIVLFTSTDLLLGYRIIPPESIAGLITFTVGMVAPWVNFVYNVNNVRTFNDFNSIAKSLGVSRWAILAAGDVLAAFAAWRIWVRGRDVLFSAVPVKEKPGRVTFVPLMGGVNGAMMGVKF